MSVRRSVVPHQSRNDASHNEITAQQINWSRPLEFQNHIIRLGGFHTLSCFITSIGKLWGDGGLADLLVDSQLLVKGLN
jgi:hypothetical protein